MKLHLTPAILSPLKVLEYLMRNWNPVFVFDNVDKNECFRIPNEELKPSRLGQGHSKEPNVLEYLMRNWNIQAGKTNAGGYICFRIPNEELKLFSDIFIIMSTDSFRIPNEELKLRPDNPISTPTCVLEYLMRNWNMLQSLYFLQFQIGFRIPNEELKPSFWRLGQFEHIVLEYLMRNWNCYSP